MSDAEPIVSILIPNYNNGRASSVDGSFDLIGRLLQSLRRTLSDDPTPFEVIVCDDGSTDDGLDTLRQWAQHRWPDGRPFLHLIEQAHCGVLSKTANRMSRAARGRILARLDGDVECLTPRWVSRLREIFEAGPEDLGVVGPKQLRSDGRIHAFGDWIIHPNGYCHIAAGAERHAVRWPMEVDHVMGCFYCHRREVFEQLDGYDEDYLRGQTVDFGLRARLAGWTCRAVPEIEFIHHHGMRGARSTSADSHEGTHSSIGIFERKWGFNRIAPDLDIVRQRYADTPLLWHLQWAPTEPAEPSPPERIEPGNSDWARFASEAAFRHRTDQMLRLTHKILQPLDVPGPVVHLGAGHGVLLHLLGLQGVEAIGVDRHAAHVELAERCVAQQQYPGPRPRFVQQTDPRRTPLDDGSARLVLLDRVLESHPNPVGLLRETYRLLPPGGAALIVAQRRRTLEPAPSEPLHPYQMNELINQLYVTGPWQFMTDPDKDDPNRDIVLAVRRLPEEANSTTNEQADAAGSGASTA